MNTVEIYKTARALTDEIGQTPWKEVSTDIRSKELSALYDAALAYVSSWATSPEKKATI